MRVLGVIVASSNYDGSFLIFDALASHQVYINSAIFKFNSEIEAWEGAFPAFELPEDV